MQNVWFTSDTHYFHANSLKFDNRPFKDVDEMNEGLIENWNKNVKPEDTVYHLGDVSFGKSLETQEILKRLNGKIILILGNHDNLEVLKAMKVFSDISVYKEVRGLHAKKIILSHFPIHSWDSKHYGSVHLHGHSHGSVLSPGILRFDMGVNCNDYRPVNWEEIPSRIDLKIEEFKNMDISQFDDLNFYHVFKNKVAP